MLIKLLFAIVVALFSVTVIDCFCVTASLSTTVTLATRVSGSTPVAVDVTKSPTLGMPLFPLYKKSTSLGEVGFIV